MKGLSFNAIYTTAFYMATVIEIPKRAITQSSTTIIAKAFEENNIEEVKRIYHKTALNQSLIGSLLLLGVWANLHSIFSIMPNGNFYEAGAYVVLLIGGTKLVDMVFGPSSEIIVLSKYYWFNIVVVSILAISGLILNYLLIPQFGIIGAAIATAISIILFNCIKYLFIYIKLGIQPFNFSFIKILMICGVCVLINMWLPQFQNTYADILFRSGIITIVFGGLALWFNISEEGGKLFIKGINFIKNNRPK
jgi:O-antigen/teichoic acid export membrane protein